MTLPAAKRTRVDDVDEPFYGFLPTEVPKRRVIFLDDDTNVDLTTPIDQSLINGGSVLTAADVPEVTPKTNSPASPSKPTTPSPVVKRPPPPAVVVPMSAITSTPPKTVPETAPTLPAVTPEPKKPMPGLKPLPSPVIRETREWKPSAQFFKPLVAGED